jgi:hypothetical protein
MVSAALVPYLAAKPLLILTGPAGTGKSKGIIELATWFDYGAGLPSALSASAEPPSTAMAFVPVGADWTDQRELLGFRNPFGSARTDDAGNETNLTYHVTTAVRLLLRATHPYVADEPHFLVLDEMNLSHVERYFSSFLSLMEADTSVGSAGRFDLVSRDDVALIAEILDPNRYPMEVEAAKTLATAQSGLPLPANVFVVGTVNVDETTYMFSPKVLDRSFVRELMPFLRQRACRSVQAPYAGRIRIRVQGRERVGAVPCGGASLPPRGRTGTRLGRSTRRARPRKGSSENPRQSAAAGGFARGAKCISRRQECTGGRAQPW